MAQDQHPDNGSPVAPAAKSKTADVPAETEEPPRDLYDTSPLVDGGDQAEVVQKRDPSNSMDSSEVGPVGSQTWGDIGQYNHIVESGRTTLCGRSLDATSTTVRLARPPSGRLICGTCVGKALKA